MFLREGEINESEARGPSVYQSMTGARIRYAVEAEVLGIAVPCNTGLANAEILLVCPPTTT